METGGASAGQARHAQRVARLRRRLDAAEGVAGAWDARPGGGQAVAEELSGLVPRGWYVLHNVNWPGRPDARLDHVLVGPGGVVVVEVKSWSGEVRVSSGLLWQDRYARTQAVEGALAQGAAVASVLPPPHRRLVRSLICMAGQPDLFGVTKAAVPVAGPDRLAAVIDALPPVLNQQAVVGLYAELGQRLTRQQERGVIAVGTTRAAMVVRPGLLPCAAGTTARPRPHQVPLRPRVRPQKKTGAAPMAFLAALVLVAVWLGPHLAR